MPSPASAAALSAEYGSAPLRKLPVTEGAPNITAAELWKERPAVLYLVRRPGCILCRAEAQRLFTLKKQLDGLGVGMFAIVRENIPEQIEQFRTGFWPDADILLDETDALYKAIGGGEKRTGSLTSFLNPFSQVWSRVSEAKACVKESNLVGDGLTLGGVFVVGKGSGTVAYEYREKHFGDHGEAADVLAAATKVAEACAVK